MLDHLLSQTIKHGRVRPERDRFRDDEHHITEDIAMFAWARHFNEALGEKLGIDADGGRHGPDGRIAGYCGGGLERARLLWCCRRNLQKTTMRGFESDLIRHFLESFCRRRPREPACPGSLRH